MSEKKTEIFELVKSLRESGDQLNVATALKVALTSSSEANRELDDQSWLDPRKLDEPITD